MHVHLPFSFKAGEEQVQYHYNESFCNLLKQNIMSARHIEIEEQTRKCSPQYDQ